MEKGYNSDIRIFGDLYHVQTEDWGPDLKILITRVFKNGAVLRSFKVPYQQYLIEAGSQFNNPSRLNNRTRLREALRNQHQKILDLLQSGQILFEKAKMNT